jgi:hypothetical protein
MPSSNTNKGKTSSVERILQIILGAAVLFLLFVVASWFYSNTISAPTRGTQQAAYTQQAANVIATAIRQAYKTPTKVWTPSPTPKPTPIPVVLYSDDFSNKQSGWYYDYIPEDPLSYGWVVHTELEIGNSPNFFYSGGQYVISIPKGKNLLSYSCAKRTFTNAVLSVDTFLVSGGDDKSGVVVIWRRVLTDNIYVRNYYGIYFPYETGGFVFIKRLNGEWTTDWVLHHSDSINKGNQLNNITVSFDGGTFKIHINGNFVTSIQDSDIPSGDICLGAFGSETSQVEVSFDNLVVYTTDSWTPPK